MKIVVALQQPDFKILSWSPKDTRSLSENAMYLGAPLAEGECLFKSLQCIYTINMDQDNQAEPKLLRKTAKGGTSRNTVSKNNRVTVANFYNHNTPESPLLAASKSHSTL